MMMQYCKQELAKYIISSTLNQDVFARNALCSEANKMVYR